MKPVLIFGGGAVGMALAVHLVNSGREVRLVRTSGADGFETNLEVSVEDFGTSYTANVPCLPIKELKKTKGLLVVTAKAFANAEISKAILRSRSIGSVILLQNGLAVERPFIEAGFQDIYRGVLYVTGERVAANRVSFHAVKPSVIGVVKGSHDCLQKILSSLTTTPFPFEKTDAIETAVWKKAVVNCAFNSLCPVLDVNNGVFARDGEALALAMEVIGECLEVAERVGISLNKATIVDQILQISSGSNHFISTLQDIRNGRPTEIDCLNLEVARIAASLDPEIRVPRTELLGRLISLKSRIARQVKCDDPVLSIAPPMNRGTLANESPILATQHRNTTF